jgi:hypothetical protein
MNPTRAQVLHKTGAPFTPFWIQIPDTTEDSPYGRMCLEACDHIARSLGGQQKSSGLLGESPEGRIYSLDLYDGRTCVFWIPWVGDTNDQN